MPLSIVTVSLALVCVESALYGIFFVLAITSLAVLIVRHGKDASSVTRALSVGSTVKSPLFIATVVLLMTVSAVSACAPTGSLTLGLPGTDACSLVHSTGS